LDHKQKKHLDLMMGKVAELLPTTERGYYGTDRASSATSAPPVTAPTAPTE
jgi:hypothetical protein